MRNCKKDGISVCMAVYNGEKYIEEQLTSILSQLGDMDEVIISDDHSKDNTLAVIQRINDKRIKIIQNDPDNRGFTQNFENALKHAKGAYIFLSDQDDVWLPGKVDTVVEVLQEYDFVVTDATVTDGNLVVQEPSHFKLAGTKSGFFNTLIKTRYIGACMAFRRKVLERALPFPTNRQYCQHDYWIACIAERYFKCKCIDKPYILYRRHEATATNGGIGKSQLSIARRILKRLYCLCHIEKRKA